MKKFILTISSLLLVVNAFAGDKIKKSGDYDSFTGPKYRVEYTFDDGKPKKHDVDITNYTATVSLYSDEGAGWTNIYELTNQEWFIDGTQSSYWIAKILSAKELFRTVIATNYLPPLFFEPDGTTTTNVIDSLTHPLIIDRSQEVYDKWLFTIDQRGDKIPLEDK